MEDVLSLIRTLLEDMEDPEEIVRPEAVKAEQEVAERATEPRPFKESPSIDVTSGEQSQTPLPAVTDRPVESSPVSDGRERTPIQQTEIYIDERSSREPGVPVAVRQEQVSPQPPEAGERYASQPPNIGSVERTSTPAAGVEPTSNNSTKPKLNGLFPEISKGDPKPANWVFREAAVTPAASPVATEKTQARNVEVADPLRFAAGVVTAIEREKKVSGSLDPQTGARRSVQQVNQNVRVETLIPDNFPVDARELFARVDRELRMPDGANGDPMYAHLVQMDPPAVGDSSEQAIAKHYASVQLTLDLDQRNTIE